MNGRCCRTGFQPGSAAARYRETAGFGPRIITASITPKSGPVGIFDTLAADRLFPAPLPRFRLIGVRLRVGTEKQRRTAADAPSIASVDAFRHQPPRDRRGRGESRE